MTKQLVNQLIRSALDEKPVSCAEIADKIIKEKIAFKLDDMKKSISENFFVSDLAEEEIDEEEIDEDALENADEDFEDEEEIEEAAKKKKKDEIPKSMYLGADHFMALVKKVRKRDYSKEHIEKLHSHLTKLEAKGHKFLRHAFARGRSDPESMYNKNEPRIEVKTFHPKQGYKDLELGLKGVKSHTKHHPLVTSDEDRYPR